jgi:hypothetical protein
LLFQELSKAGAEPWKISLVLFNLFELAKGKDVDAEEEADDLGLSADRHPELETTDGVVRMCRVEGDDTDGDVDGDDGDDVDGDDGGSDIDMIEESDEGGSGDVDGDDVIDIEASDDDDAESVRGGAADGKTQHKGKSTAVSTPSIFHSFLPRSFLQFLIPSFLPSFLSFFLPC